MIIKLWIIFSEEELAQARITAGLSAVEKAAIERAAENEGKLKRKIAGQNVRVYFFPKNIQPNHFSATSAIF